jgi:hypothetical protein
MRGFVESLKGKHYSEVIILADREATRACRNSMYPCNEFHHHSSDWCNYSKTLTEMIYFLRSEVKLKKPGGYAFDLFHSLQKSIDQQHLPSIQNTRESA